MWRVIRREVYCVRAWSSHEEGYHAQETQVSDAEKGQSLRDSTQRGIRLEKSASTVRVSGFLRTYICSDESEKSKKKDQTSRRNVSKSREKK